MKEEQLRDRLSWLLVHNEQGKRNTEIEKVQLELLKKVVTRLSSKYDKNVVFDFDGWDTSKKANGWFLTFDGDIKLQSEGYNEWYDCKKLDAVLNATVDGKPFTLFFILKGVEHQGGHQRNVKQEIGGYSKAIQRNKDNDTHFFFVLDGTYINTRIEELDKCEKYDISTTNTIESVIENFIIKNLE